MLYIVPIGAITWFAGVHAGLLCVAVAIAVHGLALFTGADRAPQMLAIADLSLTGSLLVSFVALLAGMRARMHLEQQLARTDPLTGLGNRRSFGDLAAVEISRTRRYSRSLTLAYIDVDRFREMNDRYGHATGDTVLLTVATVLQDCLRTSDVLARIGGDEFALMLPETGLAGARIAIEKAVVRLTDAMESNDWPITFSIGVVASDAPRSLEEMLQLADRTMYAVKRTGRGGILYEFTGPLMGISAS
jgi:diguanylate cyclase (GGDEF)-like protein